jgi:hypothetical protein
VVFGPIIAAYGSGIILLMIPLSIFAMRSASELDIRKIKNVELSLGHKQKFPLTLDLDSP